MRFKVIAVIIAVVVIVLLVNTVFYQALKDAAVRTVGLPVKIVSGTTISVKNFFSGFGVLSDQKEQALELQEKLKRLTAENSLLESTEQENERLRRLLELGKGLSYESVAAEVITREPFGSSGPIVLDKGKVHGVGKGNPIIDGYGNLVGLIEDVYEHSSSMIKLTDSASRIDVEITDKQVLGLVVGAHGVGLQMDLVSQETIIDKRDVIVTAGLDPQVPQGILVGEVEEVSSVGSDLFQRISVRPAADLRAFKQVLIITSSMEPR